MIQDEVNKALIELAAKREEIFRKALDHFKVPIEQIRDRVRVTYGINSTELYHIDNHLAISFSPVEVGLDGKINMAYKEYY